MSNGIYRANSDLADESQTERIETENGELSDLRIAFYPRIQPDGSINFDAALMLDHCALIHVVGRETRAEAKKELGERMRKMQAALMRLRVWLE